MYRYLEGPPIPGTSVPYWMTRQERLYSQRAKPQGVYALLSNPTYLTSSSSRTENQPAHDAYGWIGPPDSVLDFQDTFFPQLLRSNVKARVATRLKGKLKDEKWNLSVFMGELPITMRYFRKALSEIVGLYQAVKHGNLRSIKRLAKRGRAYLKRRGLTKTITDGSGRLSKRWLEWRYAICPLVYDMQDMLSYVYKASTRPIIRRAAAGAEEHYHTRIDGGTAAMDVTHSYRLQGRGVAYFSVHPYAEAFKQLGLINLVAALWELYPLSFVADMFLPIGKKLANLDAMAGVDLVGGTYSESISGLSYGTEKVQRWEGSNYWLSTGSSRCEAKFYNRVAGFDFLWTPPTYSSHPTVKQTLDIIALSRTILFKNR